MVLHRATCRTISKYIDDESLGAFTERRYMKACAATPAELLHWVRQHGGTKFSNVCSQCKPSVGKAMQDDLASHYSDFEAKVEESARNPGARRARLAAAPKKPEVTTVTAKVYIRNPDVVAEVLANASGTCQRCLKPAPFKRAKDGRPYLEVHHLVPLSEGGDDTVENAQAQCPNCHREAHFGGVG